MQQGKSTVVIVPLYNESERWDSNYWDKFKSPNLTIFFIDDGSTDGTWEIIHKYAPEYSHRLKRNGGKARALHAGFNLALSLESCPSYIGFLDADRAFDVSELSSLIQNSTEILDSGFDSIWASRVNLLGREINRKKIRHLLGRMINSVLSLSYSEFPYDSQCGFKLYKVDDQFRRSLEMKVRTRWFFELEHLANYLVKNGKSLRIWEEPLGTWQDTAGSKLYRFRSFLLLIEIVHVFCILRSSKKSRGQACTAHS